MRVEIVCMECGSSDLAISGDFHQEDKRTVQIKCRGCNGKARVVLEVLKEANFFSYLKVR